MAFRMQSHEAKLVTLQLQCLRLALRFWKLFFLLLCVIEVMGASLLAFTTNSLW